MKLEEKYLIQACHDAIIRQYADNLISEGFAVKKGESFTVESSHYIVDLSARKNKELRLYEFKIVGDGATHHKNIQRFKEFTQKLGAVPFVVYVNPPAEKTIEIDNLNHLILSYFQGNGCPSELDELSTHTEIDDIEIDELTSINVTSESITVSGDAIIYVNLVYGSNSDEGAEITDDFPMTFTITLDCDLSIVDMEYSIDNSGFYQ